MALTLMSSGRLKRPAIPLELQAMCRSCSRRFPTSHSHNRPSLCINVLEAPDRNPASQLVHGVNMSFTPGDAARSGLPEAAITPWTFLILEIRADGTTAIA